ncbi:MAG TPA: CDP-glycerol glycerophosphotransferase family protein [Defluviitaleaceae bacterium]|nr:CDP-glycerol glycerophosphotransferase family protein [Defluviitaleaceae bacterium]
MKLIVWRSYNDGMGKILEKLNMHQDEKRKASLEITVIPRKTNKNKIKRKLKIAYSVLYSLLNRKLFFGITEGANNPLISQLLEKRLIFLNHGWGTKKSPGNYELRDPRMINSFRQLKKSVKYIICNSYFDSTYFLNDKLLNDIPAPVFLPLGHPRNDILVEKKNDHIYIKDLKRKYKIPENKRIFLFAPTHREWHLMGSKYDLQLIDRYFKEFAQLDKLLGSKNYLLIFKPHYYINFSLFKNAFKNILVVPQSTAVDTQELLLISDVLITDYSSIFVDYLLLERPVIFYPFDIEYYEQIRGLVIDYNNPLHTPGPKINSLKDLIDLTEKDFKGYDLKKSRDFFHNYSDGKSAERIADFLLRLELVEKGEEKSV